MEPHVDGFSADRWFDPAVLETSNPAHSAKESAAQPAPVAGSPAAYDRTHDSFEWLRRHEPVTVPPAVLLKTHHPPLVQPGCARRYPGAGCKSLRAP
jgi:hypothetical protein